MKHIEDIEAAAFSAIRVVQEQGLDPKILELILKSNQFEAEKALRSVESTISLSKGLLESKRPFDQQISELTQLTVDDVNMPHFHFVPNGRLMASWVRAKEPNFSFGEWIQAVRANPKNLFSYKPRMTYDANYGRSYTIESNKKALDHYMQIMASEADPKVHQPVLTPVELQICPNGKRG